MLNQDISRIDWIYLTGVLGVLCWHMYDAKYPDSWNTIMAAGVVWQVWKIILIPFLHSFHRNLLFLRNYEGDMSELGLDFTVVSNDLGEAQIEELKPGGKDIPVTSANHIEYIHLMADYRLNKQVLVLNITQILSAFWRLVSEPKEPFSAFVHTGDVRIQIRIRIRIEGFFSWIRIRIQTSKRRIRIRIQEKMGGSRFRPVLVGHNSIKNL